MDPDDLLERILRAPVYDVAHETPLDSARLLSERLGNQVTSLQYAAAGGRLFFTLGGAGERDGGFFIDLSQNRAGTSFTAHEDSVLDGALSPSGKLAATADANGGIDASPRGGPPGFLQVLDDRHLAIPDLNGNNRIDSLRNIVDNPQAGLLLMVPGVEETIRINGPATLTTDAAILDGFTQELRVPKLAVVIETQELFAHCAKAYRRSNLWNPSAWATMAGAPDLAEIYTCQFPGVDAAAMRAELDKNYANDLTQD